MKLLNEKELDWSNVVANCRMNRERNLTGINSYEKDIGFDLIDFLKKRMNENAKVNWIDLCCGKGKAVIQASVIFKAEIEEQKIEITGIDLVDMFDVKKENVSLIIGSLKDWNPTEKYDLITCVHGLHYLGDKLSVLEKTVKSLKTTGKFIGNIDFDNIKNKENKSLKKELIVQLKEFKMDYNLRKRILVSDGYRNVEFGYKYLGADENAGPNYTGQEVVNSIYQ